MCRESFVACSIWRPRNDLCGSQALSRIILSNFWFIRVDDTANNGVNPGWVLFSIIATISHYLTREKSHKCHHHPSGNSGITCKLEGLVTGLVIIYMSIAPICPVYVDAINFQTPNSPDLLPKFRSLITWHDDDDVVGRESDSGGHHVSRHWEGEWSGDYYWGICPLVNAAAECHRSARDDEGMECDEQTDQSKKVSLHSLV